MVLLDGMFVFSVIILMIDLLMCFKPVPIVGIPIGLVSLFLCLGVFFETSTLPAQPYYTILIGLFACGSIIVNALKYRSS